MAEVLAGLWDCVGFCERLWEDGVLFSKFLIGRSYPVPPLGYYIYLYYKIS